jgi:ubiquinone/menaquinone biosynthesis C-methylase UbiE
LKDAPIIDVRGSRGAIRKAYDLFSFFYGFTVAIFERPAITAGLVRAAAQPGEVALDAGCGAGSAYARLYRAVGPGGLAVGIDMAARMLAATRQRVPGAVLAMAEIGRLPFANDAFDLVWSSYVLDLIPTNELTPVLREFLRVLRAGGRLALVSFTKDSDRLTAWERVYLHTPPRLAPYILGSCRPVRLAPFVRGAGFVSIDRRLVSRRMHWEIVTARKPVLQTSGAVAENEKAGR